MKRYALCVGINDYPGTGSDLSGCVNDALDWKRELERRGYEVTTLLDQQARKGAVVGYLQAFVDRLRYRDRFVFTFSGHGTWVPDLDGDEKDGRDEALCCYEVWDGGILTDDELHTIWQGMRFGVHSVTISDSCHSGTVARGFLNAGSVIGVPKFISPALLPSVPMDERTAIELETKVTKAKSRPGSILLSGCDDPEYSYDAWFDGRPNGAFTKAALRALNRNPLNYKKWHNLIREELPSAAYPQTPQLGATKYQQYRQPL